MRPLSAFKFFSQNKQKMLTIIMILIVAVASVSFITSLVTTIFEDGKKTNLATFNNFSVITAADDELYLSNEIVDEIKEQSNVGYVVDAEVNYALYNSLLGSTSVPIITIANANELEKVFNECDLVLDEGCFPKEGSDFEIILHSSILQNKDLSIGDYVGRDVDDNEMLAGKFKVVGSFSGNAIMGFSNNSYAMSQMANAGITYDGPVSVLIVPKADASLDKMNDDIANYSEDNEKITITTYNTIEKMYNDEMESIVFLLTIVIIVIVCAMAISTGALLYIVYMGRTEEFGILHAIGYSKGFIKKLIFKEITTLSSVGWLLGYVLSLCFMKLVDYLALGPNGQSFAYFTELGIIYTLIIPVMISICAVVPILKKLKNMDLISVIEKRD